MVIVQDRVPRSMLSSIIRFPGVLHHAKVGIRVLDAADEKELVSDHPTTNEAVLRRANASYSIDQVRLMPLDTILKL